MASKQPQSWGLLAQTLVCSALIAGAAAKSFAAGTVSFTEQEKERHRLGYPKIASVASKCMQRHLKIHQDFFARYRVAGYYGASSSFAKKTPDARRAELEALGLPGELADQMKPISCVGFVMNCMGEGFKAAGQEDIWKKIRDYTVLNDSDGSNMQIALQALGWKLWYWNPDTSSNDLWDSVEKERSPTNSGHTWGSHAYNWKTVQTKGVYYKTRIDDAKSMVNFGTAVPAVLEEMPFVVGTAHMGYHVFAVIKGDVVEGHSTRRITDGQTLETSVFNPLADGGGPRGHYFSGVLAVPPGMAQ